MEANHPRWLHVK